MSSSSFDTLILGQGLAGSALAWHLIEAGERVCVIDDGHRSSSTRVAAGLINPLAGMRFNRRPEVGDWLPAAGQWYARLTAQFGRPFLHPLPMLRLFRSSDQKRFHARRRADADSRDLLGDVFAPDQCPEDVAAPHGGFLQARTGYVDLPLLLTTLRKWLQTTGALYTDAIEYTAIRPDAEGVTVGGRRARRLVFCDGAAVRHNPWFDWLPLNPDKGEILDLRAAGWRPRHIVNGAYWLIPHHDGGLRLGATHDHERFDLRATAMGRDELLAAYQSLRPGAPLPEIVGHQAGIRPGTADHCPLLGRHPEQPALWVCNGFGARGALSIPWYAARLAAHLQRGQPLPVEADIRRL